MNYQQLIEGGVTQWNQWRLEHPNQWPSLRGVDLSQTYLFEINFMGTDLSGANLKRACLIGADLSQANLSDANLGGAYLSKASLRAANLSNANLIGAQINDIDLADANLAGTCLAPQAATQPPLETSKKQLAKKNAPKPASVSVAEEISLLEKTYYSEEHPVLQSSEPRVQFSRTSVTTTFSQPTVLLDANAWQALAQSDPHLEKVESAPSIAWEPALLEYCQSKLSDYYIGPMATLILDEIITIHQPQTLDRFINLVVAHIPELQDAHQFRERCQRNFGSYSQPVAPSPSPTHPAHSTADTQASQMPRRVSDDLSDRGSGETFSHPAPATVTEAFINRCQQALSDYYIAPMAQMLVDEVITFHHPKTPRQLVALIADKLSHEQAKLFCRTLLS